VDGSSSRWGPWDGARGPSFHGVLEPANSQSRNLHPGSGAWREWRLEPGCSRLQRPPAAVLAVLSVSGLPQATGGGGMAGQ